jgi:hypothetical protein
MFRLKLFTATLPSSGAKWRHPPRAASIHSDASRILNDPREIFQPQKRGSASGQATALGGKDHAPSCRFHAFSIEQAGQDRQLSLFIPKRWQGAECRQGD